ncbi:hypothetical protein N9733_05915 [Akkermansiaceae bacterium]|nr:hypothetical protein [bacterium]MDB4142980.1 hypothetical protein [Akkermansiaceae bacterium]
MERKKLNVLMLGAGGVYHSEPVAHCIKKVQTSWHIISHGIYKIGAQKEFVYLDDSAVFDEVYQLEDQCRNEQVGRHKSSDDKRESLMTNRPYWLKGLHMFHHSCKAWWAGVRHKNDFAPLMKDVDLLHLHSLFVNPAFLWLLTTPDKPLVVSCWGSDVLRTSDMHVTLMQKTILDQASVITVSNLEFKEIVMSKYGRHLEPKIVYAQFNPKIEGILKSSALPISHDSPVGDVKTFRVCIGHNGTKQCNHRELLSSIATLSSSLKSRIELYLPMTYGAAHGYVDEVREIAQKSGCKFTLFEEYMSDEDVDTMHLNTDILLYAPVSDAFSATVTKALAAGTTVIAGAWLPYKSRVISGFKYHELYELPEAARMICQIIENWGNESEWGQHNRLLASKVFSEEAIGQGWIKAYQQALISTTKV